MTYLLNRIKEILEAGLDKKDVQYYNIGKPFAIADAVLAGVIIYLEPVSTDVVSITTGIGDMSDNTIKIVLAKTVKDQFVKNAQKESGQAYLTRVMDGRDGSGNVLANTIRYLIRTNMRNLGITQGAVNIAYDTQEIENGPEGLVTATLTVSQRDDQFYSIT
jgi:hypothetical protein